MNNKSPVASRQSPISYKLSSPRFASRHSLIDWKLETGNWKFPKGFTLIEILVVVGILGVMIAIGSNIFIGVIRSSAKAAILGQVREDGNRVIETVGRHVQNATKVAEPQADVTVCPAAGNSQYIIVQNRTVPGSQGPSTKGYTRFSYVYQAGANDNSFIAVNHNDTLATLTDVNYPLQTLKDGTITTLGGATAVNVKSSCFKVQRSGAVTVVSLAFTLEQSKVAGQKGRKEFEGTVDMQTTYTLRVY